MNTVTAVVPTFRPADDLILLLQRVAPQVQCVVVIDDASPVTFDLVLAAATLPPHVRVERFEHNAGIARSLNVGLASAQESGDTWLFSVDQDSMPAADYVVTLLATAEQAKRQNIRLGAVGGTVIDATGAISYPLQQQAGVDLTDEVIQTGTLWNVAALIEIGGFDESFGIDAVDAAACVRLRKAGYSIVVSEASIDHTIGSARAVTMLGRKVLATGHSPERRTTMVRNRLRLAPEEFAVSPKQGFLSLRRLVVNTALAVTIEEDRWAKAKGSLRGLLPRRSQ